MKFRRIKKRFGFYITKSLLVLISYFSHRLYMRCYIPLLRKYGMKIKGEPRYIAKNVKFDDFDKISLSERDVISHDVEFLTHDYSYTTALISKGEMPSSDIAITKPIKIGKNVFIGSRSFILPGTIIGDNCIIAAASVVRGFIPEGSVYMGNPGKVIKKMDELIEKWEQNNSQNLRLD